MEIGKKIFTFASAYHALRDIHDDRDLKKEKLTLAEYNQVFDMMKAMSNVDGTKTETVSQTVAEWFRNKEFVVCEKGIGWEVSI